MENFEKDLDSSSFQSNTEIQFLEQVKEFRHHLYCMEKLLCDLQQTSGKEKEIKKCNTNSLSSSFPDLNLLMQEFETKVNAKKNLFMDSDSTKNSMEKTINAEVGSVNNDNTSGTLTFVVQVPNNIHCLSSTSNCNIQSKNAASQLPKTVLLKSRKKARLNLLFNKIFKRKKSTSQPTIIVDSNTSENSETLQLLKTKYAESISHSSSSSADANSLIYKPIVKNEQYSANTNSISDNLVHAKINDKISDAKINPTLIIPISYNFDEKSSTMIKSNITLQFETTPQTDIKCSNCIKVRNESSCSCIKKTPNILEKETENSKVLIPPKTDKQTTEMLLETLMKALLKTTERLNNLESSNTADDNLNEKKLKCKIPNYCQENYEIYENAKSRTSIQPRQQNFINNAKDEINYSKTEKKKKQQILKRQSSKLSICSSSGSISSDEEPCKSSRNLRPQHIQRKIRCHSPSMFNYLVCQSERDV